MKSFLKPRHYRWSRCADIEDTQNELRRWFKAYPGEMLRAQDNQCLQEILPTLFGYHLLKVGHCEDVEVLSASKIPHRVVMDWRVEHPEIKSQVTCLCASPEAMPFSADSLDVVILSRNLEFSANPHQVLREVDRCLIPEGHVVIVCFNPLGMWSILRWLLSWRERPPWCGRFIRPSRLRDWLQLLGFDVIETRFYFYRPPLANKAIMEKLGFLENLGRHWWPILSGSYIMVAKKRVTTLTPLKPRWRLRRSRIVAPGLVGNSNVMKERLKGKE